MANKVDFRVFPKSKSPMRMSPKMKFIQQHLKEEDLLLLNGIKSSK